MTFRRICLALLLVGAAVGAGMGWQSSVGQSRTTAAGGEEIPPRYSHEAILDSLFSGGRCRVVYPGGDIDVGAAYRERLEEARSRPRSLLGRMSAQFAASEDSLSIDGHGLTVIVGTPASNRLLALTLRDMPIRFDATGFVFAGRRYDDPGDLVSMSWPDPISPGGLVVLVAAMHDSTVLTHLGHLDLRLWQSDYRIWRNGELIRSGEFRETPSGWAYAPRYDDDRLAFLESYESNLGSWAVGDILLRAPRTHLADDGAQALAGRLNDRVRAMRARLGNAGGPKDGVLTIWCYADFESKAKRSGSALLEHADVARSEVHRVLERGHLEGDGLAEAEIILAQAGFRTDAEWLLTGARVWLTDSWLGWSLDRWNDRLAGMPLDLNSIQFPDLYEQQSYFLTWPTAGLLVRSDLNGRIGAAALARLTEAARDPRRFAGQLTAWSDIARQESGDSQDFPRFGGFLAPTGLSSDGPGMHPAGWTAAEAPLKGLCLAHDHGIQDGYLSERAADNLAYLREDVHASAISVSPFGYINGATVPSIEHPYRLRGRGDDGEETDESLVAITARAHELRLRVLLAPHLWGRVWCGEWRADDEAGWANLFAEYRRFAMHYAALAAYTGADIYQVGKELKATSGREAEWRELLLAVRSLYKGQITYAANWDEYDAITWWDAVDLIGINQYRPVGGRMAIRPDEMKDSMRRAADELDSLSSRFGRPYLLTEVGFTASAFAYREPWKSYDESTDEPDFSQQALLYESMLTTYANRSQCRGLFWWKWFTRLESNNRGRNRYDFPPYGKPAEQVLVGVFSKRTGSENNETRVWSDIVQADVVTLREGLPPRGLDSDDFASESRRADVFHDNGNYYYSTPVVLDPADLRALKDWAANRQRQAANPCGFHADWLIEWQAGDDVTRQHLCFGCGEIRTYSHWQNSRTKISSDELVEAHSIFAKYVGLGRHPPSN